MFTDGVSKINPSSIGLKGQTLGLKGGGDFTG